LKLMLHTSEQLQTELNIIRDDVYRCALEHGWWETERSFGELLALIHSEITEAIQHVNNGRRVHEVYTYEGKTEGVVVDLADVVIRALDIAGYYKFDLSLYDEIEEATGTDIHKDLLDLHSSVSNVLELARIHGQETNIVERSLAGLVKHTIKIADEWHLDLYNAVKNKAAYNWTRPYKHGKKF
jgi:hypothetical protein